MKKLSRNTLWITCSAVFAAALLCYYLALQQEPTVRLTQEEKQWLSEHPVIRLAPNQNFAPIEFFNQDSVYTGYTADIMKLIQQRIGVKFVVVRYGWQDEIWQAVRRHEIDVLPAVIATPMRKKILTFSRPIIEIQNVVITRTDYHSVKKPDSLYNKRIAIVRGSSIIEDITARYPRAHIDTMLSGLEALYEVSFGRADAAIANLVSASYFIEQRSLANLKVACDYDVKFSGSIGVRNDLPILASIMDKALSSISENERKSIAHTWIGLQYTQPWYKTIPWQWIVVGAGFTLFIIITIGIWNRSLKRKVFLKTLELQKELLERFKIERALRESEEKFRRIFDLSPVGSVMVGLDQKFIRCNKEFCDFLGYQEEEIAGKSVLDVTYKDDGRIALPDLGILINDDADNLQVQKRYVRKDGSIVWGETTIRLIRSDEGASLYFLTIVQNITKRKFIEETSARQTKELTALHNVERKVNSSLSLEQVTQAALHGMRDAIIADGVLIFLRDGERLILQGLSLGAEGNKNGTIPEHRVGECMCGFAVKEKAAVYSRNIFEDKRCTWKECKEAGMRSFAALPLFNGNEVFGVIGISSCEEYDYEQHAHFLETLAGTIAIGFQNAQLYSTTKAAEEALRISEEELRSFFRVSPVGIIVIKNDVTVYANDKLCELTGYAQHELLNQNSEKFYLTGQEYREVLDETRKQIEEKEFSSSEVRWRRKDETIIDVLLSFTMLDGDENSKRIMGTVLDITERKMLSRQLAEAQKMESLGTLAGGIAHDFNNVLSIIMGYADQLLTKDMEPDKMRRRVQAILTATERAAGLVRQILTFARKADFERLPININDMISDVVMMLKETFPRSIEITEDLQWNISPIIGDRTQLHQALLNLAVNARDAMPSGGILQFKTELVAFNDLPGPSTPAAKHDFIRISVRDSGTGISAEVRERIFEPFFTTKERGKGTGLGLSVVYGIVTGMKGFIDVASEPGNGTTFCIYLPAIADEHRILSVQESANAFAGGTETILFIEDEEAIRDVNVQLLEHYGYTVLTAVNGVTAVGLFKEHHQEIDIVLSDLGMPKMDGWECYRKMKLIQPDVLTIIATGFLDPDEKKAMEESGLHFFLHKPYRPEQLLGTIREILDTKKVLRQQ